MVGRIIFFILSLYLSFLINTLSGQNPTFIPNSPCGYYDNTGTMRQVKCNDYFTAYKNGTSYRCLCPCDRIPNASDCTPTSGKTGSLPSGTSSQDFKYMMAQTVTQALVNYIFSDNSAAEKAKADQARVEQERQKQIDEQIRMAAFQKWKREQSEASMKHNIEISEKIKKGDYLLEQMKTTGTSGKLEPFSTSSPTLDIQPISENKFQTNQLSVFDQLACASYFSNLAMKATKTEEAAFYSDQANLVMNGQPTYYQCRIPQSDKSATGQKMEKAKVIYNNFNFKLKDLEDIEKQTTEVKEKKETALKEKDLAEKNLDELKKEHINAPPEKKAEVDDLVAKAQQQLNEAKEQLKKAEEEEQNLDKEREALEKELNNLKKEMESIPKN